MRRAALLLLLLSCRAEERIPLAVEPDRIDLGVMARGEKSRAAFFLRNTGEAPVRIERIEGSDPLLEIDALVGIELPARGGMEVVAAYRAERAGTIDARITITSGAGVLQVPVTGNVEDPQPGDAGTGDAETSDGGEPIEDAGVLDATEPPEDAGEPMPCVPIFDRPVPITGTATNAGFEEFPALATDGAGTWVAVFGSNDSFGGTFGNDLDLLYSRSTDGGATWSLAAPLAPGLFRNDTEDDEVPAIAYGGGAWVVTWQADVDDMTDVAYIYAAVSLDGGETFSTPVLIATTEDDADPTIASDGSTFIIAWHGHDPLGGTVDTDGDINFVRSTDSGMTWSSIGTINRHAEIDNGWDGDVKLAALGPDAFIAVWTTDFDGPGYGPDDDILFARSFDGGETWEEARPIVFAPGESQSEYDPAVAADGKGRIVAAWRVENADATLRIATSIDNGETWRSINAGEGAEWDAYPTIGTDGAGTFIVAWHSHLNIDGSDTDGDIFGVVSLDGGLTFGEMFTLAPNATTDQGDDWAPKMLSDGKVWVLLYQSDAPRDVLFKTRGICE